MRKSLFLCYISIIFLQSCAPKIVFTAEPQTITKGDSVFLNWKIKGKPTLMFDQTKISNPPLDSLEIVEFTLSVAKGKNVRTIKRQVSVLPGETTDIIVLTTNDLKGDTLIASGIKDTTKWSGFEIISVSSISERPITIVHANKVGQLKNPKTSSAIWYGTRYAGPWKIMSILTEAEKGNHSIIPGILEVKVRIRQHKN